MLTTMVDYMIDRNLRFRMLEKQIIELIKSNRPEKLKIAILKVIITDFSNRVYVQDKLMARRMLNIRK